MTVRVQVMITRALATALAERATNALAGVGLADAQVRRQIDEVLRGGVACIPLTAGADPEELVSELSDYGFEARPYPFDGPTSPDLLPPAPLAKGVSSPEETAAFLEKIGHAATERWLAAHGPFESGLALWRELLRDECDKLYNQAWCAFDQIRSAEDPDSVMFLAMDDFPSAVEQAFALAPPLAGEHLSLLREYREERLDSFLREMAAGTDREAAERIDALAFWEENAEGITDLRRSLYRLVRSALGSAPISGEAQPPGKPGLPGNGV